MIVDLLFPHLTSVLHLSIISLDLSCSVISIFFFLDIWLLARETQDFFSFEKQCQPERGFHSSWPRCHQQRAEPQFGLQTAMTALGLVLELRQSGFAGIVEITQWVSQNPSLGFWVSGFQFRPHPPAPREHGWAAQLSELLLPRKQKV